ncbi:serine--tRNA ligase [Vampirovibrio sp.]|uniref:serine--tRNA ligase n=1 Tax=Vampirovibrio sp. TaxID=2717857 RepID=UPI003593028F
MLDIKLIRENPEAVNQALKRRKPDLSIDAILLLDARRRELLQEEESLRSQRNQITQQIALAKKEGRDTEAIQQQTRALADRIKEIETQKEDLAQQQNTLLLDIPNMPLPETPDGADESANVVLRSWGDEFKSRYCPETLPHYEIGANLGILDFDRGVKVAQSRFSVIRGEGSRMERALINFMLDTHTEHGYEEILPPFLVNRQAMTGTGQLPKFEADMFRCKDDELFLIPTAEVPVTNLYGGELLSENQLPVQMVAYTPCFRREAGSAGKDTRGLIRQHQFDKIELVKLCKPEESEAEHLKLLADAERILQKLELPYRVVALCAGDIGFSAARCFDIEVWMPAQGVYREISSCSVFTDFQARRIGLKYRSEATGKPAFLHTINGSGLAVGRTLAAILENYQINHQEVVIPEALRPYFRNGLTRLTAAKSKELV